MSNDTQVLRATLETALARIEDMLADDDGQAFKEARKFLESARQLSEQPGFVMVPLADEQIDEMLGEANRGFCIERDDYFKAVRDTEAAHGIAARPLTASPTAPSTEASEPVCVPSVGDIWLDSTGTHQITAVDRGVITTSPVVKAARTTPPPAPVLSDAILAHLDDLKDDAAVHIYPSDLVKCSNSECVVEVFSVRAGCPAERTVPLFSREQVAEAIEQAIGRASRGAK